MKRKLRFFWIGFGAFGVLAGVIGLTLLNPHFPLTRQAILMKSGRLELEAGNYSSAADYFLLTIHLNPRKTEAYILLADAYIGMSTGERKYVTQEGDTLQSVAAMYYNDETVAGEIFERNKSVIPDWTSLEPGTILYLPLREGEDPPDMTDEALYYMKKGLEIKENARLRKKYENLLGIVSEPEPTESPEPIPEPSPEEGEELYTVRSNDTWESISIRVYGSDELAEEIYQRNIDRVPDRDGLTMGLVIVLPVDNRDDGLVSPEDAQTPMPASTDPPATPTAEESPSSEESASPDASESPDASPDDGETPDESASPEVIE